jgi:hypothetical protein
MELAFDLDTKFVDPDPQEVSSLGYRCVRLHRRRIAPLDRPVILCLCVHLSGNATYQDLGGTRRSLLDEAASAELYFHQCTNSFGWKKNLNHRLLATALGRHAKTPLQAFWTHRNFHLFVRAVSDVRDR